MIIDHDFGRHPQVCGGLFNDADAQAAQFHGYDQQYQQLSRGPFRGQFRSFLFGEDLGIHLEKANRSLAQAASTPAGRYGICLLLQNSPPCTINAGLFTQNHVALCPENRSLEAKTPEDLNICCMDMSRKLLPDEGQDMRTFRIVNDADRSLQLRELILSGLSSLTAFNCGFAAIESFKSSIVDLLWQIEIDSREKNGGSSSSYATARALHIFRQARDCIHDGMQEGISIVALCRYLGVSRRSLEHVFQSVIGTGPSTYVHRLQLNRIRRDLISQANAGMSIGDVAARHGLWHWSRFAQDYRMLFGELPSQTRNRHRIRVCATPR